MRTIFDTMDYFTQEFSVPEQMINRSTWVRGLAAFLFGFTRATDPSANRSAERALVASRNRVDVAVEQDASDDWKSTGEGLRATLGDIGE